MPTDDEQPLTTWGSGRHPSNATRRAEVVLKSAGPWSPTVVALLAHLEQVGFPGAPRVVDDGFAADGRMAVTYVPGGSPHPRAWPDDACAQVGVLLRQAHEAASSFNVPPGGAWQPTWLREVGDHEDVVIGHGDPAPWNIVGPSGSPGTLVDWDLAGPVDRLTEVAYAVWLNAQLHDDDIAEMQGLPVAAARARQARDIADGYGVPARRREALVDRMVEVALAGARADAIEHRVTPESTEAVTASGFPLLWSITWRSRSAAWMLRNRRLLVNAMVGPAGDGVDRSDEVELTGGNASARVVRIGGTVRKPWLPTTERTVAYLQALRRRGIDVPEPRGRDEHGRLVLGYVPGRLAMGDAPLEVDVVRAAGALVRSIHDASTDLPVPADWEVLLPASNPDLVCHNDLATWNLVIDGDRLVFIDWDGAGPSTRLWDLAYAAISFGHLFPGAETRPAADRLAAFVDGYAADRALRDALPHAMTERAGAMHDLLRRSHESGREPWGSMYADGHGEHWRATTTYVAEHQDAWRRALSACDARDL